ncbi:MAG: leucyl/phenylalanyl-tRNA--protein transferase [Fimbriimonadaceae bacterium]|nr:leucyl/phenylalanyl-tRNA--protein transferase [Fimbriimonadaceae bacterium]
MSAPPLGTPGHELSPWMIRYAYSRGVFPMAESDGTVFWYEPAVRALFPIDGVHVSRSLRKRINRGDLQITFDEMFEQVMRCCLRPSDNWISEDIIRVYTQIHAEGWGHSCEVWCDSELVGGIYGIALGNCFSAESMFHRRTDMSKVALWAMVEKCRSLGFTIFDAELMNPHLASMGAYEITQFEYLELLEVASRQDNPWDRGSFRDRKDI